MLSNKADLMQLPCRDVCPGTQCARSPRPGAEKQLLAPGVNQPDNACDTVSCALCFAATHADNAGSFAEVCLENGGGDRE